MINAGQALPKIGNLAKLKPLVDCFSENLGNCHSHLIRLHNPMICQWQVCGCVVKIIYDEEIFYFIRLFGPTHL